MKDTILKNTLVDFEKRITALEDKDVVNVKEKIKELEKDDGTNNKEKE